MLRKIVRFLIIGIAIFFILQFIAPVLGPFFGPAVVLTVIGYFLVRMFIATLRWLFRRFNKSK